LKLLQTGKNVKWKIIGDTVRVTLPAGLPANTPALAFAYSK